MAARRLEGKVALITGGARGQGAAEAELFAQQGARVMVTDVLEREGHDLVAAIRAAGGSAVFHALDVTDADQWGGVVAAVEAELGGLDILINNAGINVRQQLTTMARKDWDRLLDVNLTGPMLGIKACVPLLQKRGKGAIVNVGSLAGLMGHPTTGYSAAKWGLRGLTKSAALELARYNIRVNAMHPGLVATPIIDSASPAFIELRNMTPLGRAGSAQELANVALFLASDESSFVTGIDIPVDGGLCEFGTYHEVWKRGTQAAAGGAVDRAPAR